SLDSCRSMRQHETAQLCWALIRLRPDERHILLPPPNKGNPWCRGPSRHPTGKLRTTPPTVPSVRLRGKRLRLRPALAVSGPPDLRAVISWGLAQPASESWDQRQMHLLSAYSTPPEFSSFVTLE